MLRRPRDDRTSAEGRPWIPLGGARRRRYADACAQPPRAPLRRISLVGASPGGQGAQRDSDAM